jgi:hypothetical protein
MKRLPGRHRLLLNMVWSVMTYSWKNCGRSPDLIPLGLRQLGYGSTTGAGG